MSTRKSRAHSKWARNHGPNNLARPSSSRRPEISMEPKITVVETLAEKSVVPYDENLLERSRTQWQFGDWQNLAQLDRYTLQHHPDRAKLALLAAAALLQSDKATEARQFVRLAQDWGCPQNLITRILVAGVHNSLGRMAALTDNKSRALQHFKYAIEVGTPASDARLSTQARVAEQFAQLGLPMQHIDNQLQSYSIKRTRQITDIPAKVNQCMQSDDVLEAIDTIVASNQLSPEELILFYIEISDQFAAQRNSLTALHFLQLARDENVSGDESLISMLVKKYVALGRPELAADLTFQTAVNSSRDLHLSQTERNVIQTVYNKQRQTAEAKSEHGHDLLLTYLQAKIKMIKEDAAGRIPLVIEIGTTREDVPGQGSTRKIAEFCM